MTEPKLNDTSYAVLGMISLFERVTPYELKQFAAVSVGYFWTLHQAQLYAEPERLAEAGHVTVEREKGGRRRKLYSITESGREVLDEWVAQPTAEIPEMRDPALLRLFMSADPVPLADAQVGAYRARLAEYEALAELELALGQRLSLERGIRVTRELIAGWEALGA